LYKGDLILKRFVHALLGSALVVIAFWLGASQAKAQFSYLPLLENGHLPLCRVGINGHLGSYPIKPLRLGWYLDYGANAASRPHDQLSYFPMLRLEQIGDSYTYATTHDGEAITAGQLQATVAARPGTYWFIGNEPDRKIFQDDVEPQIYARAYHELYYLIKGQDPTAKIVAGAIVQPTPVRLQYLDMVLSSYYQLYQEAMPVDAWAFHNFILNEASCAYYEDKVPPSELGQVCWGADIPPGVDAHDGLRIDVQDNDRVDLFKEQVIRFRQWMADRGYRNTPAFLSEFGILMPQGLFDPDFNSERVNAYMNQTFDFLMNTTDPNIGYPGDNNHLIQRFAWYSVDDNFDHNGFLFDRGLPPESARTAMGDNFVHYVNGINKAVDFFPTNLRLLGAPPLTSAGTTTLTLEATIGNSGNLAVDTPATVRFFNGNPNSGGVQIGSDQTVRLQGCGEQAMVSVDWASVAPGDYTVYVQVQTTAGLELDESDNQSSMAVSFSNNQLLIPNLKRDFVIP
jgi:hypothetical protein